MSGCEMSKGLYVICRLSKTDQFIFILLLLPLLYTITNAIIDQLHVLFIRIIDFITTSSFLMPLRYLTLTSNQRQCCMVV